MKRCARALFALEMAGEIHDLSGRKSGVSYIFCVQKHDAPPAVDAAIAIVQAVDGRVELIVAADGHHQQLAGRKVVAGDGWTVKLCAARRRFELPFARGGWAGKSRRARARAGCSPQSRE